MPSLLQSLKHSAINITKGMHYLSFRDLDLHIKTTGDNDFSKEVDKH
jgi:hypothetical protein